MQWGSFLYDKGRASHDIFDPLPVRAHIGFGGLAGAKQRIKPTRAPGFGADFGPTQQISFAQDADHPSFVVDDRQPANAMLQHQLDRLGNHGAGRYGNDFSGHHVGNLHHQLPLSRQGSSPCNQNPFLGSGPN